MVKKVKTEMEKALSLKKRPGPRRAEDWYVSPEEVEDAPYLKAGSKGKTEPVLNWNKAQGGEQQDGSTGAGLEQQKGLEGADAKGKGVVEHDVNDEDSSDFDSLFREDPEVENGQNTGLVDAGAEVKDVVEQDAKDEDSSDVDSLFGEASDTANGLDAGKADEITKQSATNSPIERNSNRVAQKHEASSPVEESGADVEETTDVNMTDVTDPKACDMDKKAQSDDEPNPPAGATGHALTGKKLQRGLDDALEKSSLEKDALKENIPKKNSVKKDALEKAKPQQKQDLPTPKEADTEHRLNKRKFGGTQMCEAGASSEKHQRTMRDSKKVAEEVDAELSEGKKPSKEVTKDAAKTVIQQMRKKVGRR